MAGLSSGAQETSESGSLCAQGFLEPVSALAVEGPGKAIFRPGASVKSVSGAARCGRAGLCGLVCILAEVSGSWENLVYMEMRRMRQ